MDGKQFAYNYMRNRDKLFANLVSIIDGILSDGSVNEAEILYLDTWLLDSELISNNPCVKLLQKRIAAVLADGVITSEELEEIKSDLVDIQRRIMDLPDIDLYSIDSDVNLLSGLCKGLIADKKLDDHEVRYLSWWLTQNGALKSNYPGKDLYKLVCDILSDGVITQEESESLHDAIVSFTGCDLSSGAVDGFATRLPIDKIDNLSIKGATFCLTGKFLSGKRAEIAGLVERLGGVVQDSVTMKLDYLVVGLLSSRDWKFSSHGRKIEKAISYRDENRTPLKIMGEETLIEFLPTP